MPWTNHIYIEYDLIMKWPPPVVTKIEPKVVQETPKLPVQSDSTTLPADEPAPLPAQPDDSLNIHYTVSVKGYNYSVVKYSTIVLCVLIH